LRPGKTMIEKVFHLIIFWQAKKITMLHVHQVFRLKYGNLYRKIKLAWNLEIDFNCFVQLTLAHRIFILKNAQNIDNRNNFDNQRLGFLSKSRRWKKHTSINRYHHLRANSWTRSNFKFLKIVRNTYSIFFCSYNDYNVPSIMFVLAVACAHLDN
jgi:hypothetical protein